MELKIKDYEKFRAYYCGLCREIKKTFGNLPRFALNYDMAFLAVLLDSINEEKLHVKKVFCAFHPTQKKIIITQNSPIEYAAFCNVILTYYKLLDNVNDDNSLTSKVYSSVLNSYLKKAPKSYMKNAEYIAASLNQLYTLEKNAKDKFLDELSHPFADLTGFILSSYLGEDNKYSETLYNLGYNLGKWIYIIDAYDDLEKDIKNNKFNAINEVFNKDKLSYDSLVDKIKDRIDFTLVHCAQSTLEYLDKMSIEKNYDLLYNILQFGLMEKMDKVFNRSLSLGGDSYEKSI
jgi:predicted hydrocarbon binding protein